MELKENDYIVGVWFLHNEISDIMITLIKREEKWLLSVRLRFYRDDKVWGSEDKKKFFTLPVPSCLTEEKVIEDVKILAEAAEREFNYKIEYLEIKGDFNKFMFLMAEQPWAHIKTIPIPKEG